MTRRCSHNVIWLVGMALSAAFLGSTRADVPRLVHFQGKLRQSSGVVETGPVSLRFKLYDHATAGAVLFDETHGSVALDRGLFSVVIGSLSGGIPDSALIPTEVYLGTSVGGQSELAPRIRVGTAPYARKARYAESLVAANTLTPVVGVNSAGAVEVSGDAGAGGQVLTSQGAASPPIWNAVAGVPAGGIIMWSGAYNAIPAGYQLCDGTNGTPDLRDRFVYGVNSTYGPGNDGDLATTGGNASHTHTVDITASNTTGTIISDPGTATEITVRNGGTAWNATNAGATFARLGKRETTASAGHVPPYYKIAFIMKLP